MDDLNGRMLGSKQVAEMLGISVSYAYKIIDQLNRELEQAGYLTLHGKVDSLYLKQRFFPNTAKIPLADERSNDGAIQVSGQKDIISTPKTPSSVRKVSMPAFLCDELREYIDMLYFPAPDQRIFAITKSKLTHRFHKLSEEAGLRRITVHGLRHSHVSLLISKKYDIFEVSKRIGHKSIKTTQDIYGHLFDEVQKTIANDLDSLRRR